MQRHALDRLVVDRTTRLVAQLLDLARVEDDQPARDSQDALDTVAMKIVIEMQDFARRCDEKLRIVGDGRGAEADPVHLGLALRNVVENAIMPVTVALTDQGIEVRDQGPGIDPHELPHVTARFFTGKKGKGTGLGLAIAEAARTRIGGGLKFDPSDRSGQGGASVGFMQDAEAGSVIQTGTDFSSEQRLSQSPVRWIPGSSSVLEEVPVIDHVRSQIYGSSMPRNFRGHSPRTGTLPGALCQ